MTTRAQVLAYVDEGWSYQDTAARLGIDAGLAYMIATGIPADGSDTVTPDQAERPGILPTTQHLANPATAQNPTTKRLVRDWLRVKASEDEPMRAAAARRDAVPGEVNDPDEQDVSTVVTRDHNRVSALLKQLSAIPGHTDGARRTDIERRESIVDLITVAVSRHEAVEEERLWPVVRSTLAEGDQWAERALEQEREVLQKLAELGECDPDSDEYDEQVQELSLGLRRHIALEEQVLLALSRELPAEQREKVGHRVVTAKRRAPTRPRPRAAGQPPAVVAGANTAAAAVDKARDAVGQRPAKRRGKGVGESESKPADAGPADTDQ